MTESLIWLAFWMGIISACSLPMGTLTTLVWKPSDRAVGILMSFGGGALLAALTLDLVGAALARGHFVSLALGCIAGGIIFVALDQMVNNHGGFLRKSSTVIQYVHRQRRARFKKVITAIERATIFHNLPSEDVEYLARSVEHEMVEAGVTIIAAGDPSEFLYIVEKGEVTITDPRMGRQLSGVWTDGQTFGWHAFITGSPNTRNAVATEESSIWKLSREHFQNLLHQSPNLVNATKDVIASDLVAEYLMDRQELTRQQYTEWRDNAIQVLENDNEILNAISLNRHQEEFVNVSNRIGRIPLFRGLSRKKLAAVADRLYCVRFIQGDIIFKEGDLADRFYIVKSGRVAMVSSDDPLGQRLTIGENQAFGGKSFITGATRANSVVASVDTELWVLRKTDFNALLKRYPRFQKQLRSYLADEEISEYLESRKGLESDKVEQWIKEATESTKLRQMTPSVADMAKKIGHGGAPMAIWLGIMLDGVPESLVIGSSLIHSHVSLSLIAGLFLSNYPEALSSSIGMRQQGMSFMRVFIMWGSLTILTGIGAALGNIFFVGADPHLFAVVEGVAAGAMLTMIAQTMAPEAYIKGGSVVGLSTLLGFLAAVFCKTLGS